MATISTDGLVEFCKEMTGIEPTDVYGSIINAAQHDTISKILQTAPQKMDELVEVVAITSNPTTIAYDYPGLRVYVNDFECRRTDKTERLKNKLSMFNDCGETFYYYMVGDSLYIHPYNALYYNRVHTIVLNDEIGTLSSYQGWTKYEYPVNLYYAQSLLFRAITAEIDNMMDSGLFPYGTYVALDFTNADLRLADDDIEMLGGELEKLNTILKQYDSNAAFLQVRNLLIQNMFLRLKTIRSMYLEYWGLAEKS